MAEGHHDSGVTEGFVNTLVFVILAIEFAVALWAFAA